MQKGYNYIYKYLILYIVLSFIDNKNIINCQKIKNKLKLYEMSNEVIYDNRTQINLNITTKDSSNCCNYSALAQKSDLETENNERK